MVDEHQGQCSNCKEFRPSSDFYKGRRECRQCLVRKHVEYLRKKRDAQVIIFETDGGEWRDCVGYYGYQVSDLGNVRRTLNSHVSKKKMGKMLKWQYDSYGYPMVYLCIKGKRYAKKIHRLVAEAFIPKEQDKPHVAHNDGNRFNPRADNLRWDTHKGNHADRWRHGTMIYGEACHMAKVTKNDVLEIRKLYSSGGITQKELGKKFNVTGQTINAIISGKNWGWIK